MIAAQRDPSIAHAPGAFDQTLDDLPACRTAIDEIAEKDHARGSRQAVGVGLDLLQKSVEFGAHAMNIADGVVDAVGGRLLWARGGRHFDPVRRPDPQPLQALRHPTQAHLAQISDPRCPTLGQGIKPICSLSVTTWPKWGASTLLPFLRRGAAKRPWVLGPISRPNAKKRPPLVKSRRATCRIRHERGGFRQLDENVTTMPSWASTPERRGSIAHNRSLQRFCDKAARVRVGRASGRRHAGSRLAPQLAPCAPKP